MTPEEAERYLLSLELFGMRFGLDRMRRLMTALGHPERRFESIHVVGTNGKSSTVRMIAAILARHGLRTGATCRRTCVSFAERIRIGERRPRAGGVRGGGGARGARGRAGRPLAERRRPRDPVRGADRGGLLGAGERGVEVAVIEAGLGGRYDATNVIPSKVQVLTSVGLEHTRWLGPTIADIAAEKLDVVQPGRHAGARLRAAPRRARRGRARWPPSAARRIVQAGQRSRRAGRRAGGVPAAELRARASGGRGLPRRARPARRSPPPAAEVRVPGRLQVVDEDPLTLLDGAHNPDGDRGAGRVAARAARGPRSARRRRLDPRRQGRRGHAGARCCRHATRIVFTSSQNPRALPPPTLQSLAGQLHGPPAEIVPDPRAALRRARELAGPAGSCSPPARSI